MTKTVPSLSAEAVRKTGLAKLGGRGLALLLVSTASPFAVSAPANAETCLLDTNDDGTATDGVDTDGDAESSEDGAAGLACGVDAVSEGAGSIAVGTGAVAGDTDAISIGVDSSALANRGIAIGSRAESDGENSIVIGANAIADTTGAIVLGAGATVLERPFPGFPGQFPGTSSQIAIGVDSLVTGNAAIGVGFESEALNGSSIAIGAQTTGLGLGAVAIGSSLILDNGVVPDPDGPDPDGPGPFNPGPFGPGPFSARHRFSSMKMATLCPPTRTP